MNKSDMVKSIKFSPDSRYIAFGLSNGNLVIMDVNLKTIIKRFNSTDLSLIYILTKINNL